MATSASGSKTKSKYVSKTSIGDIGVTGANAAALVDVIGNNFNQQVSLNQASNKVMADNLSSQFQTLLSGASEIVGGGGGASGIPSSFINRAISNPSQDESNTTTNLAFIGGAILLTVFIVRK